ncbi:MAG: hypothetical protein WC889_13970 [Myxococcota bacterium]|jgi:hypothetical protein
MSFLHKVTVAALLAVFIPASPSLAHNTEMKPVLLEEIRRGVSAELEKLDNSLAKAAAAISVLPLDSMEARNILKTVCTASPYMIDCATVDLKGRLVAIEPAKFRSGEGQDIGKQEHFARLSATMKPVLSGWFKAIEGMEAVDLQYPIIGKDGKLAGAVSTLISPAAMMAEVLSPYKEWFPISFSIMQKDGRILFDSDSSQTGRLVFKDPIYKPFPTLLTLWKKVAADRIGSGQYKFSKTVSDKTVISKDAHWDTVDLHGTEWRIVLFHQSARAATAGETPIDPREIRNLINDLQELSTNRELAAAMAGSDMATVSRLMSEFYNKYKLIYSVQWVDDKGVNRFGHPAQNSLKGYDFHQQIVPSDEKFLDALKNRKGTTFEDTLAEGNAGLFILRPVFNGESFMGFIYLIRQFKSTGH